jgi:S1-C subfamily serine protease
MNDHTFFSRVCPACRRRVPNKVAACRCGQRLDTLSETVDEQAPAAATPAGDNAAIVRQERGGRKLVATSVVVAAITGGTVFLAMRQSQAPASRSAPRTAAPLVPVPVRAVAQTMDNAEGGAAAVAEAEPAASPIVVPAIQVVAATASPNGAAVNATPPAAALPGAAPSALEDIISRAMPAVVRVETGGGFGSGFFVAPDTMLTNVHVVGGNSSVTIRRTDGSTIPARVDATAPEFDIAIMRISNADPNQATLAMGSGMQARAGQEIVALGTPLGLQNTVTRGIVSAVRAVNGVTLVQTDAAINPGNSGGPLLDRSGSVIGIATMGMRSAVAQGLSFGVAIEHAQALLSGRRSAATGTPVASLSQAMTARPGVSESDVAREASTRTYEQVIAAASRKADDLDGRWRSFKGACYAGRVTGSFDREWFAFWEPRAMQGAVSPGCSQLFADIRRSAEDIRGTVLSADEGARQAGVYPGRRRDILKRYRLDYSGWDR